MTVKDNLTLPLRSRGACEDRVRARVTERVAMPDVTDIPGTRASRPAPDKKQKISMGRRLVRNGVNVIMCRHLESRRQGARRHVPYGPFPFRLIPPIAGG